MTTLKRLSILLLIFTLLTTAAQAYYDPYTGRFLQRDPVGQGVNWYIYGMNNPMKYTDPTGMWIETWIDIVGLGLSIHDFIKNPSLGNATWVLLDAGAVVVPIIPGTKAGRIAFKWVTKSDPAKLFKKGKQFTKNNFRESLITATGVSQKVQDTHHAHHLISKKYRDEVMERFGINVDHPSLMAWWKKETHQSLDWDYRKVWEEFLKDPNLTKNDVLLKAKELADKYKDEHFYNKEYYLQGLQLVPHSAGNYDQYDQN